ncbi:MAG: hypothetical protein K8T89_21215 [Planctomycetes bacterium]|nr:hypothetical protein [Planctomycetota bacterium]
MDSPKNGMDMASTSQFPRRSAPLPDGLPEVRVEVRNGSTRPTVYELTGEEFLIGSVPGCDLRLPGTNLPPVICLIARMADGVRLRKLAPTLPVLVNGQPISQTSPTSLTHGDCISIGAVDIQVAINLAYATSLRPVPARDESAGFEKFNERSTELQKREAELREREQAIAEQAKELESDRILWYRRRDEIEQEMQQAKQAAVTHDRNGEDLVARANRLFIREEELNRRQAELKGVEDGLIRLRDEVVAARNNQQQQFHGSRDEQTKAQSEMREALEKIRKREENLEAELALRRQAFEDELHQRREQAEQELRQWHDHGASGLTHMREQVEHEVSVKFRQRSEELDRFQLSLREAVVQLRERKQQLEEEIRQFEPKRRELLDQQEALSQLHEELDQRQAELKRDRDAFEIERRTGTEPLTQKEKDLSLRESEIQQLRKQLDADREIVDQHLKQYQADLVRLDRWQVTLDEREKQMQARATEVDRRFELFERDTREIEEQVQQIDAREELVRAEELRQAKQREDIGQREAKLNERLAQIEGQQAMIAALRTRLEHMREEQRLESARITEERSRIDEYTRESQERLRDAELLREQLSNEQSGQSEVEKLFRDRSEILQQAVTRMRELQQQLTEEDTRLRQQAEALETKNAELAERESLLKARTEQLIEQQHRLEADRQALKQREENLFLTEGTRESLQDQLRRRADELINRGQELDARNAKLQEEAAQLAEQRAALETLRTDATGREGNLQQQTAELARRDEELKLQGEKLQLAEQAVIEQRRQFEEAQSQWEQRQREADEKAALARKEIEDLKQTLSRQAADLFSQVPDLESRAQTALERTSQARESLRGQLTELHAYTKQSQDDLDKVRGQVQAEIERMAQQESGLNRARSEHRHAVASFRQQLMEWQTRFADMKQALSQGESRVERREKVIEATSQNLARQAEEIETKQREVTEKRDEMQRHLNDMREWYRKKLRELVASKGQGAGKAEYEDGTILPIPQFADEVPAPQESAASETASPVILSMHEDLDPADRKLGELLQTLELVDAETLQALWGEARRQHRPLRQVLLASNYLSLYQLALIETGNLNGLMLGRFRVIDRIHSSPREAIYRVFDPQSIEVDGADRGICLLRHLGEAEMQDAIHPDEYRQRFSAARDIAHPNIAATREVLDINGRPAVVQAWLRGQPGSELPAAVGMPGVWFRLLSQAALGLHTAHQAGLVHGRLTADSLLLTHDGVLKITGLGEPPWLHSGKATTEYTVEEDLRALGRIVHDWSQLASKRKGKKGLTEGLLAVLRGLGAEESDGVPMAVYPSLAALLEDLDQASRDVPADVAAWEKLLEHVAENSTDGPLVRKTA